MLLSPDAFRRLCRARDLLAEVREQTLTVTAIAREVGFSPFHFIRQFEALFGLTPHQFRLQLRLDRARRLLARGDLAVTEVCMELGFSSLGSFSGLFTRRIGVPPSVYRRRVRVLVHIPASLPDALFPGCLSLMAGLPLSAFRRNFREAPPGGLR